MQLMFINYYLSLKDVNIPLLIIKYDEVINEVLTNFISF